MVETIELSGADYYRIANTLFKQFGKRIKISWVQQKELGITLRIHRPDYSRTQYFIDFFSEHSKTLFILKYM